ncbi:MAG: RagB/SusD family nutrient uptake outer membrane protein [Muribaculaceae bacterium]|nr:RagB/SusD family nutrient uptake outer membrane protein [Muribaculaceae bacterium]
MKNKFYSILFVTGALTALTSCSDVLDADKYLEDRRTLESVFTDINQTNAWLTQSFSFLRGDLADCKTKERTYFQCFADDMYYGDRDEYRGDAYPYMESYNAIKQGDYNENFAQNAWYNAYKGIYQASVFIQNIDMNDKLTLEERLDMKGQARFVRAYYYWLLLRRYGPVPIMPENGADYTLPYEELATPRSTYEEVAEFIGAEMVQACEELQSWSRFQGNTDATAIIRPTKGAALATRALAYLYAASPLANGQLANGYHPAGVTDAFAQNLRNRDGQPLLSLTYDESKWARAAAACRDVIECEAHYELYHAGVNTSDNKNTGYPKTITPPDDGDFSTKAWPDGWMDIDPYLSYRDYFNGVVGLDNSEIIFSRGYNADYSWHSNVDGFVTHQMPNSLFGFNSHGLTQKMVDAYYMNDGTDVAGKDSELNGGDGSERSKEWTTTRGANVYTNFPPLGPNVSMQYANREPRFYACVSFNGSYWWDPCPTRSNSNRYQQIFYYRGTTSTGGSSDGSSTSTTTNNGYQNNSYYLRTGIGCKKWVNPNDYRTIRDGGDYDNIVHKWEPAIRYADILLMYAEALNELNGSYSIPSWDGKKTYNISRDVTEMKRGIRPVRCRAGLPDYTPGEYGDQMTLRNKIKRERMIELMGEGKRYYDLRRWMDAPVEESKTIYGCNVMMTSKQPDEFQRVVPIYNLPTVFADKMYFWPICFDELKRNKELVQNPGWQTQD